MTLEFYKYHGAGNDFVVIDNRQGNFDRQNTDLVHALCTRRFGIGADGLMLVQDHPKADFEMVYYNADGFEGSLCGNGGRCIVAFANHLGIIGTSTQFMAVDGMHEAKILADHTVRLKMGNITSYELENQNYYLNSGSPHYVVFSKELGKLNVYEEGRKIRYNERFSREGTNVNFVQPEQNGLFVRTYERGVENETFACGTGIVASAIAASLAGKTDTNSVAVRALGGNLRVDFEKHEEQFSNIWLEGPAELVFRGNIEV